MMNLLISRSVGFVAARDSILLKAVEVATVLLRGRSRCAEAEGWQASLEFEMHFWRIFFSTSFSVL